MDILQILRIIFGFAFVLFIPGFAFTMALWPRTKTEVHQEIVKILKSKGSDEVCIVGSADEEEDLIDLLKEKFRVKIYDTRTEREIVERVDQEGVKNAKTLILADSLEEQNLEIAPEGKIIIDLAANFPDGIKVEGTLDVLERIALSFGLSIAIVPLIGLILNYTPFGIRLESVFVSLVIVITVLFGIYYNRRKKWSTSKSSS